MIIFLAAASLTSADLQEVGGPKQVASVSAPAATSQGPKFWKQGSKRHPAHFSKRRTIGVSTRSVRRVTAANHASVIEPASYNYLGSTQVYPWTEGALYKLYTSPGQVSDVELEAGERLISVAAGDTVRWIIGDTESGTGPTLRTHILVKPTSAGLKTNLVIATDRRVYHIDTESFGGAAMTAVSWNYPVDALVAVHGRAPTSPGEPATGVEVESFNFNYRIEGDRAPWRPLRAFDDGRQVFIEFPPTLVQGEAPPLFVRDEGGQAELVNYRVRGRYYVVDRLFDAAELRLGEKRQRVVRIVREGRPS